MRVVISFTYLFFLNCVLWAQTNAVLPKEESRPYYQLTTYPSGFDRDSMDVLQQELLKNPKIHWKNADSTTYMFSAIVLDQHDDAMEFYTRKKKFKPQTIEEFHLIQFLFDYKRRFPALKALLQEEANQFPERQGVVNYRMRVKDVQQMILSGVWSDKDSVVFHELRDAKWSKVIRASAAYSSELIPLIAEIDEALRTETKYEYHGNQALALAFHEFGIFLRRHLSLTDAFIAFSVGRYYDKLNFDLTESYRSLRSEMNDRSYVFPSMRKLFPKQTQGIFSKESIAKRQDRLKQADSAVYEPYKMNIEEDTSDSLINQKFGTIIMLIGILLLLLFVIFFVKSKRN